MSRLLRHGPVKVGVCLLLFIGLLPFYARAQQVGTCEPALGEAQLDVNNVRARIFNNGGLFWRGSPHVYEVPKGSGVNAIFASAIWFSGLADGELRIAATRYGPYEFWAGPLDENGHPPADCSRYDRVWTVSRLDVLTYEETGYATRDLRDWPTGLDAPTLDADGNLIDVTGQPLSERKDRAVDLGAGERPALTGHQMAWWIMNDRGNTHDQTDAPPVGVEIHGSAFAFQDFEQAAIDNTTFYRYRIVYRGEAPLDSAYFGAFVDSDLGAFDDDYVGSDTTLGLGYTYNADNDDEDGYGANPPAVGVDFVQGLLVDTDGFDNDRDGTTDEPGERLGMTSFVHFFGGGGPQGGPSKAQHFYNYMQARWKDGEPMTVGGDGRGGTTSTRFWFPGDPVTGSFWSEVNVDGEGTSTSPFDKRFVMSTGPLTMQPGEVQEIVYAIVWARGEDHLDSVAELREADRAVQTAFDAGLDIAPPAPPKQAVRLAAPADGTTGQPTNLTLRWEPTRRADRYQFELTSQGASPTDEDTLTTTFDTTIDLDLQPEMTYRWRVRAANAGGFGPWSDLQRFSTSDVTLEEAGALRIDGSPMFVEVAAPGGADPCPPSVDPAFGCEEVGGDHVYVSFSSGVYAYRLEADGQQRAARTMLLVK